MSPTLVTRRMALGAVLALSTVSSTLFAQAEIARPRPERIPSLPCCKCLGESSTLNLSTGKTNWTASQPGNPTQGPTANAANVAWTTSVITTAQWISPVGNPTATGDYTYQTRFNSGNCTIPSMIVVSGKFLADNRATLLVDGVTVATSVGTPNYGFLPGSLTTFTYTIPANLAAGAHNITLVANNQSGPTGVIADVQVTRKCTDRVEMDGRPQAE